MHIGINALCFLRAKTGISRYFRNLVMELARLPKTHHTFTIFVPPFARGQLPHNERFRFVYLPSGWLPVRILLEQLLLPVLVVFYRIALLHSVGNYVPLLLGNRNIVTVHDIYYVHDPKRFGFIKLNYLRIFVRLSVWFSRRVITVSRCTKKDILDRYLSSPKKIAVIYEGAERLGGSAHLDETEILRTYGITDPYYLFVSSIEPGKNLLGLLKAFTPLADRYQLLVAGKWGWGYEPIVAYMKDHTLQSRAVFAGHVPDEHLAVFFKNALACVLPSFHEGFGLPVIEAMAEGCPVCCSNTSSLPEVAGDAALLFNPYRTEDIETALRSIQNSSLRKTLIEKGYHNSRRFSWGACAAETLALYDEVERELGGRRKSRGPS